MSTPSNTTATDTAGPPVSVAARDSNMHPLVRLTSMHGTFVLETVGQWVMADRASQEAGTPDSLAYLTESMRFLMDAIRRQQDMGQLCRLTGGGQKAALIRAEATFPVLKDIGMDTADLEAGMKCMRAQSQVLESIADIHAGNADQVVQFLNSLELRIHAVMHPADPGSKPLAN
jgi:hypothetical protein